MVQRNLAEWLDYQQRVHPRSIELGLERVREVWQRMGALAPAPVVITIGGTNGKGSTVAFLEAMLAAAGHRVGSYTSPHLLRYNERIRVDGVEAGDAVVIDAFDRIEYARREIALTYFEFGTLAALWIFAQSGVDVALLEVGLGGRLDAVNIIDADAAIVTTIDLDHQDWLGNDRDTIGGEKAGIFRRDRPAIIGTSEPPDGLLRAAERIGATQLRAGRDFHATSPIERRWTWRSGSDELDLPVPFLAAPCQIENAAAAIAALHALRDRIPWNAKTIAKGIESARIEARLQCFVKAGAAEVVVDVGHNPQAARTLAQWLAQESAGRATIAVFGALSDKDVGGIVTPLRPHIARWLLADLQAQTPRGLSASELRDRMPSPVPEAQDYADVASALDAATRSDTARVLAFGSFFVAGAALEWLNANGYRERGA